MILEDYLRRIGFDREPTLSHQTLKDVARHQVLATVFENIDVQLKRTVSLEPASAYDRIVKDRRGGWCYELNGLLGWALETIGFDVMRIAATVERSGPRYGEYWGDHLCLVVTFQEERFLVDAGFGGGLLEPMPLRAHRRHDPPYTVELEASGVNQWRYRESAEGSESYFDFLVEPGDEAQMAKTSAYLQRDPDSPFTKNLVAQRRHPERHEILRGRVRSTVTGEGKEKTALLTAEELAACLAQDFDLHVPEIVDVWPAVWARHEQLNDV